MAQALSSILTSFKLNIDGSYLEGEAEGAVAGIRRNSGGILVTGFAKSVLCSLGEGAEALALLEAFSLRAPHAATGTSARGWRVRGPMALTGRLQGLQKATGPISKCSDLPLSERCQFRCGLIGRFSTWEYSSLEYGTFLCSDVKDLSFDSGT